MHHVHYHKVVLCSQTAILVTRRLCPNHKVYVRVTSRNVGLYSKNTINIATENGTACYSGNDYDSNSEFMGCVQLVT